MPKISKVLAVIVLTILLIGGGYFVWTKGFIHLPNSAVNSDVAQIQARGKLIIGMDATFPPLEFVNEKGELSGFGVDLANRIAKDMNVKLELRNITFDKIFDALNAGEIDLIISSLTITTERQKEMLFSTPYLNSGQSIIARSSTNDIADVADLKNKKVGVQKNTTSENEAIKYTNLVKSYADYNLAENDLVSGKIDAVVIDFPAGVAMTQKSNGALKVIGNPFTSEFYGVVAPLNKNGVISAVNQTIQNLKAGGELNKLVNLWLKR